MERYIAKTFAMAIFVCTAPIDAQFVPDEFNSVTLGSQWTWNDSSPTGSAYTLSGTHLQLKAIEGADLYFTVDNYAYLQQDAPAGTNWEIVTKVEGFDPSEVGRRNDWNKCGIKVWQDNDHWFGVWVMGNNGNPSWQRWIEGGYDCFDSVRGGAHIPEYSRDAAHRNISSDPIWLKIQKTEHGYFGYYSTDGTTWLQVSHMIRNSQNPDGNGYFTNEKVRILQSGPGTNGVNDTASFDFIHSGSVNVPTAPNGTNDEFDGTELNASLWGKYYGVEHSAISVAGGKLLITPQNFNDQWGSLDRAVRVYQDAPTTGDWQVTVKAGPTTLFDYQDWSGYGIMIWQDHNDYVLISNLRAGGAGGHVIQTAYQRDDAHLWNDAITAAVETPQPEYLRITKVGTNYTASYSSDNVTYSGLPSGGHTFPVELKNPQVQLFAKKVNDQPGPLMTAEFDWVHFDLSSSVSDWQIY